MRSERLEVVSLKVLILLKDFWESENCNQCKDYCGISCTLYPGSQKRVVALFSDILNTKLTLTPPRYQCLAKNAGFYEKREERERELELLEKELEK